jgi:hypothetical protein
MCVYMSETKPAPPSKLRTWAVLAAMFALAILLYPPQSRRYDERSWLFLFSSTPGGKIDYGRLSLEVAAGLFAALFLTFLPLPSRWRVSQLRVSRKLSIGMFLFAGCVLVLWILHVAVQMSTPFPPEEIALLGGQGAPSDGWFSGKVYNGSRSWTVREVTIRIILKSSLPPLPESSELTPDSFMESRAGKRSTVGPKATSSFREFLQSLASEPQVKSQASKPSTAQVADDEKDYRIGGLWLLPLETGDLRMEVLSPTGLEFDGWRIVSAKGFKNYW